MHMIVVGCGRVGSQLAYRLFRRGNDVTVMDSDPRAFASLPVDFRGRTVQGDVIARDTLRRAKMETADGVAAVTSSDAVNAVVARIAVHVHRVPTVVVRNYDSRFAALQESVGVPAVSSTRWGAQRIEELLTEPGARSVFSAGAGEVRLYEFVISPKLAGRPLADVVTDRARVVSVTRAGSAFIPDENVRLEAGDVVHVSCTPEGSIALHARFAGEEG
jgi:trk system potassium uptake protein TrkA